MNKLFTLFLVLNTVLAFSQIGGVGINASGSAPDPSAILDLNTTNKGLLMPRLTQGQRDSIPSPAFGLLILNTSTNCINLWLGATWKQICGDCDFNNPIPGNNGPVCAGQTLNLTASNIVGATYQWTGPNGFTSNQQNPSIVSATSGASGTYSVAATLNGCTTQVQNTAATVNPIPQTPVAGNNGPQCVGQTLNITSSTVSGATYNWSGPNGYSDTAQNPSITNVQTNQAGTYTVVATMAGCNSAPSSTTATINAVPGNTSAISGLNAVCGNATGIVYFINSIAGANSYNWTVPSGASITSNSDTAITVTFGSNPVGNITVSGTGTCGTSSQSNLSISLASLCSPQTFNASSSGYSGSIQTFVAPVTATYTIQAFGAAGGTSATSGGYGASMQGDFSLTQGQQLNIMVGQAGANPNEDGGGGGGGGTFVVLTNNTPLIVAGGGGGGGDYYAGGPGLTGNAAGNSTGGNTAYGGTIGSGGNAGGEFGGAGGGGGTCCNGTANSNGGGLGGGGGAGFTGDGGEGQNYPNTAASYLDGGYGSYLNNSWGIPSNSYGGYGGGGNGVSYTYQAGGGGGGGYTGGAGGAGLDTGGGGGGGGSYNTGANQNNQQGVQTGNGQVIITW